MKKCWLFALIIGDESGIVKYYIRKPAT